MARPDVLNRLKELGWDGPTSYTLPTLNEFVASLEGGMSVEDLKANRKKTSDPAVKGNGRQPKGEWVQVTEETPAPEGAQTREVDIMVPGPDGEPVVGGTVTEYFVPTPKPVKEKPAKGEWVACEDPGIAVEDVTAEYTKDGIKYRLAPPAEEGCQITWQRWQPKQPKGKLTGSQQANFDPREMLRAFENQDMRVRAGGRDWTMIDTDWLQSQLDGAKSRGDAAIVVDVSGSQESCDVVWLEALVAVKRRLALREEANGDTPPPEV